MTSFMVSLYAALAVALPIIAYQLWAFMAPAFEERDQKLISRLVIVATILFVGGIMFSYFVVLPAATPFLLNFDSSQYNIQIRARDYYSFVAITSIAIGILFELPVFILGLTRVGVLSSAKLRKNRRIGIVICFAVAVALPGIDPITTTLQAVPLLDSLRVLDLVSGLLRETLGRPGGSRGGSGGSRRSRGARAQRYGPDVTI